MEDTRANGQKGVATTTCNEGGQRMVCDGCGGWWWQWLWVALPVAVATPPRARFANGGVSVAATCAILIWRSSRFQCLFGYCRRDSSVHRLSSSRSPDVINSNSQLNQVSICAFAVNGRRPCQNAEQSQPTVALQGYIEDLSQFRQVRGQVALIGHRI